MDRKPQFRLEPHGRQTRVVENSTDLIWRTLDSRSEAANWVVEAVQGPDDRKAKSR